MTGLIRSTPDVSRGDRLVVRRRHQGALDPLARRAVILEVLGYRSPCYRVRWEDNGLEGRVYPGPDVAVEHAPAQRMNGSAHNRRGGP